MAFVVPVAHDFNCPWCWIALSQVKRLEAEFDVEFDWRGYELYPEWMDWPESSGPKKDVPANRPSTPSRFDLALAAEGLPKLTGRRPSRMKTFRAHQAVEFARDHGVHRELIDRLYRAYWVQGLNINELDTLKLVATGLISDLDAMIDAIEARQYRDRLVEFDDDAYECGVYNVPTYFIGDQRFAEEPTSVLREALAAHVPPKVAPAWDGLGFAAAPPGRPTTLMNMVSTMDGKILTGERNEAVMDLGSKVDHATLRYIESLSGGVLIGAGSLRATKGIWFDTALFRFVATESGNLPWDSRFFTDAPEKAVVMSPTRPSGLPEGARWVQLSDWTSALHAIRSEFGVDVLLIEGGSELNATLLRANLVDELFLTLAPKVKLGRDVPTLADGEPLRRDEVQNWDLVDLRRVGDEIFLRYRRPSA